jgi:hypothetical protein
MMASVHDDTLTTVQALIGAGTAVNLQDKVGESVVVRSAKLFSLFEGCLWCSCCAAVFQCTAAHVMFGLCCSAIACNGGCCDRGGIWRSLYN